MKEPKPLDQDLKTGKNTANHAANLQIIFDPEYTILDSLMKFASSVADFRRLNKGNIRHSLSDILILSILARASGFVSRADIREFGLHNLNKFQKLGMLENGVPSEATLCRVENGIDDVAMANAMQKFAETIHKELVKNQSDKEIVCIDGKAERGTTLQNGRNPDIVSAYSYSTRMTLATEACQEKSNEIKAVPILLNKIDIAGRIVTMDAMSMQKVIIDKVREKEGDFLIELKANQRSLRYGVEDRIVGKVPLYSYKDGPELGHGRIETRTYNIYDGLDLIVDKEKWGGNMTIIEYVSETIKKSTKEETTEKRLYVCSLPPDTPALGSIIRKHWSIESMHWGLDVNLLQDDIKRKTLRGARNLDTIQRIVLSTFSIWRCLRKKLADKNKGNTEIMRNIKMSFTKLANFLGQKFKKSSF